MRSLKHRPMFVVAMTAMGLWAAGVGVRAADLPATSPSAATTTSAAPPAAKGNRFAIAVLPDPQAYTQSYDITKGKEKWSGKGYQYKDRLEKQVRWIVESRVAYNIRFAVSLGDNVQHFGYDAAKAENPASWDAKAKGEWLNAQRAFNLFHADGDPAKPAHLPYAIACGNHDYHRGNASDLDSHEYVAFFGPGRWKDADGAVPAPFRAWYRGDDQGWEHKVNGQVAAAGVGRNSVQVFSAAGREWMHLTLECAPTDQALAWAASVLARHPGTPTILSTHAFMDGGGKWLAKEKMGRYVPRGKNPTNDAQGLWDKFIKVHDQVFLVLCGHTWGTKRVVVSNAAGHDVHIMESCYHLGYGGGRIRLAEKPPGGWAYAGTSDDLDRNGSGWMRLLMLDPDKGSISAHTYSPVLGLWAANRPADDRSKPDGENGVWWNRTFPFGEAVTEEIPFDFKGRFPRPGAAAPATAPTQRKDP